MWNTNGYCRHKSPETATNLSKEEELAINRIKDFVLVGAFLEEHSGKDILSMKASDFPEKRIFDAWASSKKLPNIVDYNAIIETIKRKL